MSNAAAFRATIHGLRTVPSRGVLQVTIEAPIEQLQHVAKIAEHGKWVAVARIAETAAVVPAEKERRAFTDMSPAQQAGMLCADRAFRLFLAEKFDMPLPDPEEAANVIRHHCKVKSRKDITADNAGWSDIVLAYRLWQREPEIVG